MTKRLFLVSIVVAMLGCSSSSDGAPSTTAGPSTNKPVPSGPCNSLHCNIPDIFTCWEWASNDVAGSARQQRLCTEMGGTVGGAGCPTDKQVAGCRAALIDATDGCSVTWGYSPITSDDVKADCDEQKGVFIAK